MTTYRIPEILYYDNDKDPNDIKNVDDITWLYKINIKDINNPIMSNFVDTCGLYIIIQKLYRNSTSNMDNPTCDFSDRDNKNIVLNIGKAGRSRKERINERIKFLEDNNLHIYTDETEVLLTKGFDNPFLREFYKKGFNEHSKFEKCSEEYEIISAYEEKMKDIFYPLYEKEHEKIQYPDAPTHVCYVSNNEVRMTFGSKYYRRENIARVNDRYVMRTTRQKT